MPTQSRAQFGKNIVQYENFDFKYVSSEHFDIYYHQGGYELAKYCAVEAERSLKEIEFELNYSIKRRISFVVFNSHNQFQQNNVIGQYLSENTGGVTTLLKNRIVIPYQGDYAQYQHVIFHELVHGVINEMFHGGTYQTSISTGGFFMPTWLNEGLCEYLSNHGMDTETDMFMRDVVLNEKLPPLQQLGGYIQYRVGQTFYWYISEKYGREKVGEFINRLRVQKSLGAAMKASFKMSLEDFSEQFEKDIKKYYFPDIQKFDAVKDFAEEVTDRDEMGNFYNSAPSISPDGERMAFISEEGGLLGVYVMRINDMDSRKKLVSSFRQQDFEDLNMLAPGISWSPDGSKISISAKSGPEDAIFIVDSKDGDYEKLTFGLSHISSVDWSPDGEKLSFVASEDENCDIYTYEFASKEVKNITGDIYTDQYPVWSPDNSKIFFVSDRFEIDRVGTPGINMWNHPVFASDIFSVDVNTGQLERITRDPWYRKTSIAVESTGERIIYVSDKNGIGNLYIRDLDNGANYSITNSVTGILQISLSQDDSQLLFSCQIEGGYDIFNIKFPFTRQLEEEILPLTTFREEVNPASKFSNPSIIEDVIVSEEREDEETSKSKLSSSRLLSSENYEVELENQKFQDPNPDAIQRQSLDLSKIDTTFKPKEYKTKWSPDVILGNPGYNTFWGFQGTAFGMFSDELGNHQITVNANLFQDLNNSNIVARYSYMKNIIDYHFTGYYLGGRTAITDFALSPINSDASRYLYRFNNGGVDISGSYALDLFQRVEFGVNNMFMSRTSSALLGGNPQIGARPDITRFVAMPQIAYVYDNSLGGWYGPSEGTRLRLEMTASPKLGNSGLEFFNLSGDVRQYFGLTDFLTFAVRGNTAISLGNDRQTFYIGGMDNWLNRSFRNGILPFQDPEDFAFMNFEMPMRGWAIAQTSGSKMAMMNAELRFPLFYAIAAGGLPLFLQAVQGSFFFDAGAAWDEDFNPNTYNLNGSLVNDDLLMSSGVGIRTFFLGLPLRFDVAWRKVPNNWSQPEYVISLGGDW
ncbi:MAG: DPP IV N-terminal domain-containing protein [Candidatus Kapaibacteriales bacterium]